MLPPSVLSTWAGSKELGIIILIGISTRDMDGATGVSRGKFAHQSADQLVGPQPERVYVRSDFPVFLELLKPGP